ncbi:MAG TPA: ABC transporter permease subunit [Thermoplasmata archaeon]|nr:ABC transporter permease subunit [Thermoplasmata archaeon]
MAASSAENGGVAGTSVPPRGNPPRELGRTGPTSSRAPLPRWTAPRVRAGFVALAVGPLVLFAIQPGAGQVGSALAVAVPDLAASFTRLLLAYLLSLGFALVYGYFAASTRSGERVLIPVLDILQSLPILGFFPIAIVLFVDLTPGSPIGENLASIFLIFTSMSWNMVFGVYESLKSVPAELREASDSFDVRGWHRIRRVLLPATVNRLVYNSVLSWTGGWYFLVAAEFISTATSTTRLPGIGTYLLTAAGSRDGTALTTGLVLLVLLIIVLDLFVWRPLGRWAEKYRYDQTPSGEGEVTGGPRLRAPLARAVGLVRRGLVTGVTRIGLPFVALASRVSGGPRGPPRPFRRTMVRYLALGSVLVCVWLLLIAIIVSVYHVATGPISPMVRDQLLTLPAALGSSAGRLAAAYAISVAIALPLASALVQSPRLYRLGLPAVEIVASVPATALFPAFLFVLLPDIGAEATSILMLVTGMIWYLFFNLLSGMRGIPPDLTEAARSYGITGNRYRRRLLLPAIFPAFVTGSITALGGGWNALVIAEYLHGGVNGAQVFRVLGIGELIDIGNAEAGGLPLMVAALFTMVLVVVVVNELIWKPLYRRAVEKYRYD